MDYPRVTEILKIHTYLDLIPPDILRRASERGTIVHSICAGIAKGAWMPDAMIDEELLGYINSFRKWAEEHVEKFLIIEKRYMDETLEYTGQLDFVVMGKDKELYLIDLKTSSKPQKTYPIQMAAYENLLSINNIKVKGAKLVYLNKTGEFPEIHYLEDLSKEFHIFVSALDCWKYFHKGKNNGVKARRRKKSTVS